MNATHETDDQGAGADPADSRTTRADNHTDALVAELFAHVTARLEDAHALAVAGQAGDVAPPDATTLSARLNRVVGDVSVLLAAIAVLAEQPSLGEA